MAEKIYDSVIFKNGSITIKEKSSDADRVLPPSPIPLPESDILSGDYNVSHYFWIDDSGKPFLAKKIDGNKVSIWHYTINRKWLPIHQAKAFDNFSGLKEVLKSVNLDTSKSSIKIGEFDNHLEDDFKLKISSKSLSSDNHLPNYFLKTLPSFFWSQDVQYNTINEAYVLQIRKKNGFLVFSSVFSKDVKMNREVIYRDPFNNVLPSSFNELQAENLCYKKYTNYNTNNDEKIEYEATIYAIYDNNILYDKNCKENIKNSFLAKDSLKYYINTSLTVETTGVLSQNINKEKDNIEGSIKLRFFNNTLKKNITDYSEHIIIKTNTEINTSISSKANETNDEHIRLEVNKDGGSLYILAKGFAKETLDGKYIELTFLKSIFNKPLQETQQTMINIKGLR